MEISIHIGFPKTGTSAIQSHINSNQNWFAKRGVYIPKSGYSSGLGHCFLFGKNDTDNPPKEIAGLLGDTSALAHLAEEIQACEKAGFDRVLMTWESFSVLDRTLISKLKTCLGNYNVTLYAYVREQAELTQSLILQAIKTRRSREAVFSSIADESLTSPWYLDFFAVFSMWKEVFGDGISIRTKIYERNLLLEFDIVADFLDWLGFKIDVHFATQGVDVNHSLDFRAAAVLALAKAAGLNGRGMSKLSRALSKSRILSSGPQTHPYISTGLKKSKFGIAADQALKEFESANKLPHIDVVGVHCHIGSQLTQITPFVDAIKKILSLIQTLQSQGVKIRYMNIGGGLGITYSDETPPHPKELAAAIAPLLQTASCEVIMEPGRSIVGNAGILVTKVLYNKKGTNKQFVIVDAAMNDLLRPSLYDAYHDIQPILKNESAPVNTVDVVGPICESGDFLAKDRKMPQLQSGDLLAVMSAGAYGFTMASNYNSRPKTPEVLVKEDTIMVIRQRETYEDLIRGESIPEILA